MKVRKGGDEEIPLVQGKEQRLCFAEAAVKRYPAQGKRNPSKMVGVARGHQRASDGPSVSWSLATIWSEAWLVDLGRGKKNHVGPSPGIHS